ncbi:hypothetical protein E1293_11770 [Actinomadura darangshiensis]|uniref:RadC-like JAB domain-containing protein n=1 Tax=Actinomadura darangshiensis TaxID=705336 RepID=A0A4R5BEZ5_9ACTN|nr:hypothetical protein E1293_11770 [Actinomadura darangshiensis]
MPIWGWSVSVRGGTEICQKLSLPSGTVERREDSLCIPAKRSRSAIRLGDSTALWRQGRAGWGPCSRESSREPRTEPSGYGPAARSPWWRAGRGPRRPRRGGYRTPGVEAGGEVLRVVPLVEGATDRSLIPVRDVLSAVLSVGGAAFGIEHNHPSGRLEPSPATRGVIVRRPHTRV